MPISAEESIDSLTKDTKTASINVNVLPPISSTNGLNGINGFGGVNDSNASVIEVAAAARAKLTAVVAASSAFHLLNQDYGQISKPNAIVRPVRRTEPIELNNKPFTGSNEFPKPLRLAQIAPNEKITRFKPNREVDDFTEELDCKLKRLQKDSSSKSSSKNGSIQDSLHNRPLFITTVPKGVFLEPVKELHQPSRRIYAYASRPRIFTNRNSKEKYSTQHSIEKDITATINGVKAYNQWNKLRENGQKAEPLKNLMFDKRIIRGSNYNQSHVITAEWNPYFAYAGLLSGKSDVDPAIKEAEARRRQILRKRCASKNQRGIIGTPPPIPGRRHEVVQTEKYLEELLDRPPEKEISVQTDLFLQRPPSPPFVPARHNIDAATEILDGELFDFDMEVQPILETLVGHIVQQGLVEVMHEEEIAELKKQQQELLTIREADLAELRRLEAEEVRLQAEKKRRIRQDEISASLDNEMQEKITAAKLLKGHVATLIPGMLKHLDMLEQTADDDQFQAKLCTWLTDEVSEEVGLMVDCREILVEIIKEIIKDRAEAYRPKLVEQQQSKISQQETVTELMIPEEDGDAIHEIVDGI